LYERINKKRRALSCRSESPQHNLQKRSLPYEPADKGYRRCFSKKQDIMKVFRAHLEIVVNTLLMTGLTAFLDVEDGQKHLNHFVPNGSLPIWK